MPQQITSESYISVSDLRMMDNTYTDFNSDTLNFALARAYDMVNAVLATEVQIPLRRNSNDDYDGFVKDMQAYWTLGYLYMSTDGDKSTAFNTRGDEIKKMFNKGELLLEEQISKASIGIGTPLKAAANRGSGKMYADQREEYSGDYKTTYTFEITTAGAVGTAVYKWIKDRDLTYTTGVTTDEEWASIDAGLNVRFTGADTTAFIVGDIWTIKCNPLNESQAGGGTSSVSMVRI